MRVPKLQTCAAVRLPPPPPDTPFARAKPMLPGVVRVDVATFQTADTSVPKVSRERPLTDQTPRGMVEASDVEAVKTVASVCALMVDIAEVNWLFVFAFMFAARLVEAVAIALFVFALITATFELEAFRMFVLAVVIFVLAVASEAPRLDDAARTLPFVVVTLAPMVARVTPRDVEARSV